MTVVACVCALAHKKVHVADDCKSADLANALRTNGSLLCEDMLQADAFVMKKPGAAPAAIILVSAMRGTYHLSPSLLLAGQGHALKFKPIMMATRLTIFIMHVLGASCHEKLLAVLTHESFLLLNLLERDLTSALL